MKKDLDYYLNLPYEILVRPLSKDEGGGYFARYKDFPYVMGDGDSEAEAIKDAREAFKLVVATDIAEGKPVKEPADESKKVRINVSLSQSLLNAIDAVSKNRSAFLERAANAALAQS